MENVEKRIEQLEEKVAKLEQQLNGLIKNNPEWIVL